MKLYTGDNVVVSMESAVCITADIYEKVVNNIRHGQTEQITHDHRWKIDLDNKSREFFQPKDNDFDARDNWSKRDYLSERIGKPD